MTMGTSCFSNRNSCYILQANYIILLYIFDISNVTNCKLCSFREEFTQEFKHDDGDQDLEDADQWHLVNAIRPDGPQSLAYHPLCYEDKEIDAKDDKMATIFNNNLMQKANSMNDSFRNKTKFDSIKDKN